MKTIFSLLIVSLLGSTFLFGQCDTNSTYFFGFKPPSENLPCVVANESYSEFLNASFDLSAGGISSNDIIYDSIAGMPNGINYSFNRASRLYSDIEIACIHFEGTTNDTVGRYPLYFHVSVTTYSMGSYVGDTTGEIIDLINNFYGAEVIERPYLEVVENEADCNHKLTTGISNFIEEIKLQVYPNPTSDNVYFKSDQGLKVEITNLKGQVVVQQQPTFSQMIQLDVVGLSKGIYFYKVENENNKISYGKMIVK